MWQRPDKGLLAGTILQIEESEILILQDLKGQSWWVDIAEAKTRQGFIPAIEMRVKMAGEKISTSYFKAEVIGVWRKGDLKRLQLLRESLKK